MTATATKPKATTKPKAQKLDTASIVTAAKSAKSFADLARACGFTASDVTFRKRVNHLQQGQRELAGTREKFQANYTEPRPQAIKKAATDKAAAKASTKATKPSGEAK